MAGKNIIQFLRGTSAQRTGSSEVSLAGQPLFETDTNKLYIGDGSSQLKGLKPISSLSAQFFSNRMFVGELTTTQWIKIATIQPPSTLRYSVLLLVNGGQAPSTQGSGLMEFNSVRITDEPSLYVCSGYIDPNDFCYVLNEDSVDIFVYCGGYQDYQIAVVDELVGTSTNNESYVTLKNEGTGSSTMPAGGVPAEIKNIASLANELSCTGGTKTENIDNYYGSEYWGKTFFFGGGNQPAQSPAGSSGGYLSVRRAGSSTTVQIWHSAVRTDSSYTPTTWQRSFNNTSWTDWEEFVTSDGTYETLTAGNLLNFLVKNTNGANGKGWYHILTIPKSELSGQGAYSLIFLINEVYNRSYSGEGQSGLLEIDAQTMSSSGGVDSCGITILSGNLLSTQIGATHTSEQVDVYYYLDSGYEATIWTRLSEGLEAGAVNPCYTVDGSFYGTDAPSGMTLAVNRNTVDDGEL